MRSGRACELEAERGWSSVSRSGARTAGRLRLRWSGISSRTPRSRSASRTLGRMSLQCPSYLLDGKRLLGAACSLGTGGIDEIVQRHGGPSAAGVGLVGPSGQDKTVHASHPVTTGSVLRRSDYLEPIRGEAVDSSMLMALTIAMSTSSSRPFTRTRGFSSLIAAAPYTRV
jgi:hypothetical protein